MHIHQWRRHQKALYRHHFGIVVNMQLSWLRYAIDDFTLIIDERVRYHPTTAWWK